MKNRAIPVYEPNIGQKEIEYVEDAVKSGWVSSKGPYIERFEKMFSSFIGAKYGVSASNGTTALHLAVSALGIGAGDEVIAPNLTFVSPINSVIYNGGRPVLVDSNENDWNVNYEEIENRITERTKAIIVVHLYGHPCDMGRIKEIAEDHNLRIIEDCAEAIGAEYRGQKVGSFGDISCFSFYGNKIITTGEGGMCLTKDEEITEKIRELRDHGMKPSRRYWHDKIGYNYRMTNLQAALGVAQMERIESFIDRKREIAKKYNDRLRNIEGIQTQPEMSWAKNVYWMYSILVNYPSGKGRDRVINALEDANVETRPFFYPVNIMSPYTSYGNESELKISCNLSRSGLNLPSGTKIMHKDIDMICDLIGESLE